MFKKILVGILIVSFIFSIFSLYSLNTKKNSEEFMLRINDRHQRSDHIDEIEGHYTSIHIFVYTFAPLMIYTAYSLFISKNIDSKTYKLFLFGVFIVMAMVSLFGIIYNLQKAAKIAGNGEIPEAMFFIKPMLKSIVLYIGAILVERSINLEYDKEFLGKKDSEENVAYRSFESLIKK